MILPRGLHTLKSGPGSTSCRGLPTRCCPRWVLRHVDPAGRGSRPVRGRRVHAAAPDASNHRAPRRRTGSSPVVSVLVDARRPARPAPSSRRFRLPTSRTVMMGHSCGNSRRHIGSQEITAISREIFRLCSLIPVFLFCRIVQKHCIPILAKIVSIRFDSAIW